MFFTECARLAEQHPDLASVFKRLDSKLEAMGIAEVIRPDDMASFLNIDPNQTHSALDLLAEAGVLLRVEMIECTYCEMAALRSEYLEALDEYDEYRCTSCDRPLTDRTIQIITAYRRGGKWQDVSNLRDGSGDTGLRQGSSSSGTVQADLQRLIEGKETIEVSTAARYLELSLDHVRRLAREEKLTRVGRGRPMKISTKSLREYKGQ
jgi:excisionase family DNA binding protein